MDLDHPAPPPPTTPTSSSPSPHVRPPPPPVALISSSDVSAWPKFKLDQLFVEWLSRPDSTRWLSQLLDHHRAPRTPERERLREKPAPGSPVSRLFSNHIPFGDDRAWDHPDDPRNMSALDLRTPAQPSSDDVLSSAPSQNEQSPHPAPNRPTTVSVSPTTASTPAAVVVAQPQPQQPQQQQVVQPMQTAPSATAPTASAPMQSVTPSVETKVLEESKPAEAQAVSTNALPPVPPSPVSEDSALMTDAPPKRPAARQKRRILPQFYFPCGRDRVMREKKEMAFIEQFFRVQRDQKHLPGVTRTDIAELVVEVIGLPSYFAGIVFNAIVQLYGNTPERAKADIEVRSCTNTAMQNDVNVNSQNANQQSQQDQAQPQQDATMGDIESPQRPNGFMSSPLNDSTSNTINNNNNINNINTNNSNSINNSNNHSNHSAGAAVDNLSNNKASAATITSTTSTSINSTTTTATKSANVATPNDSGMSNNDSPASSINSNNNNSGFSSFSSAAASASATNNPSSSSTNTLAANNHPNSSLEQQLQQSQQQQSQQQQQQQQRHQVVADPTTVLQSTGGVTPTWAHLRPVSLSLRSNSHSIIGINALVVRGSSACSTLCCSRMRIAIISSRRISSLCCARC